MKAAAALAAAIVAAAGSIWPPHKAHTTQPIDDLRARQEIWLDALEWCESRGVETAVNPRDRDGTPSYGALQFKPSTYAYFAKRYGLASTTDYTNAAQQREIVRRMIADPGMSDKELRARQFPDCIQRVVGLPPRK